MAHFTLEMHMKILTAIRVGVRKTFGPGQEKTLIEHAEVHPEQIDFLRLLDTGCIDEVPEVANMTPEQREARKKALEAQETERIRLANEEAEQREQEAQELIRAAHERAQAEREKAQSAVLKEVRHNTGDLTDEE